MITILIIAIYFSANPDDLKNFNYLKLLDLNNFTNTSSDLEQI